ncbi:MAG: RNA polymerase sigma-70 factor [Bacteroidota bacterium]
MSIFSKSTLDIRTQAGFTILYKSHSKFVYNVCKRYIENKDASENITSDIFTSIWERREELHRQTWGDYSWKRYLSQAAKHQVFKYLRIKKQLEIYFSHTSYEHQTFANATENDYQFAEISTRLNKLIGELPPKCQHVFRLSREKGLSNKEIAEHLNISVNAVKKHIGKAIGYLKLHIDSEVVPNHRVGS